MNWTDLVIIDAEGNELTGGERESKLKSLHRDGTMLDAWIFGEDENNPIQIDWTGFPS